MLMMSVTSGVHRLRDVSSPLVLQVNLGNMYYSGLGVEKNWDKAKELYRAASATNENAKLLLKELEEEEKNQPT